MRLIKKLFAASAIVSLGRNGEFMSNMENFFAVSIRGESHVQSGKPMQDYSVAVKNEDICVAVVCDGHGADKHFRSEIGSKLAAEIASEKLCEFAACYPTWSTVEKSRKALIKRLKLVILTEWQNGVEAYTVANPFTEEELSKVSATYKQRCSYDQASPYGTTMLAALICKDYYLLLMIGDGAIIQINPDFTSNMVVFPGKIELDDGPHGPTDSMCASDNYRKLFDICEKIEEDNAIAFALCSDGLSEAFSTDKSLMDKLKNYLNFFAEEGMDSAVEAITAQLNQLTKISWAQDDISLAFATRHIEAYDKREEIEGEPSADSTTEAVPESVSDASSEAESVTEAEMIVETVTASVDEGDKSDGSQDAQTE